MHDDKVDMINRTKALSTKALSVTCNLRCERLVLAFEPLDHSSKSARARSVLLDDVSETLLTSQGCKPATLPPMRGVLTSSPEWFIHTLHVPSHHISRTSNRQPRTSYHTQGQGSIEKACQCPTAPKLKPSTQRQGSLKRTLPQNGESKNFEEIYQVKGSERASRTTVRIKLFH